MIWFRISLKLLAVVLLPIVFWGFICPALVSTQSDILVPFGFLVAWLVVPGMLVMFFWMLLEIPNVREWWETLKSKFHRRNS